MSKSTGKIDVVELDPSSGRAQVTSISSRLIPELTVRYQIDFPRQFDIKFIENFQNPLTTRSGFPDLRSPPRFGSIRIVSNAAAFLDLSTSAFFREDIIRGGNNEPDGLEK